MNTAHHYHRSLDLGGYAGQSKRVADIIGYLLNLATLIIVGHDDGTLLLLQTENLLFQIQRWIHRGADISLFNVPIYYIRILKF